MNPPSDGTVERVDASGSEVDCIPSVEGIYRITHCLHYLLLASLPPAVNLS